MSKGSTPPVKAKGFAPSTIFIANLLAAVKTLKTDHEQQKLQKSRRPRRSRS